MRHTLLHNCFKPRRCGRWLRGRRSRRAIVSFAARRTAGINVLSRLKHDVAGTQTPSLVPQISGSTIIGWPGTAIKPGAPNSHACVVVVAPIVVEVLNVNQRIAPNGRVRHVFGSLAIGSRVVFCVAHEAGLSAHQVGFVAVWFVCIGCFNRSVVRWNWQWRLKGRSFSLPRVGQ